MRSLVMVNNGDGTYTSWAPIAKQRHNDRLHTIRVFGVPIVLRPFVRRQGKPYRAVG